MLAEDPGEELCPHQWVSGRPQFKVIFPFGFTCGACSFLPGAEDQSPVLKVNLRNQFIHIPPTVDREPGSRASAGGGILDGAQPRPGAVPGPPF